MKRYKYKCTKYTNVNANTGQRDTGDPRVLSAVVGLWEVQIQNYKNAKTSKTSKTQK